MDDIVKELRERQRKLDVWSFGDGVLNRAADEIERLRLCIRDGVPASVALGDAPTAGELVSAGEESQCVPFQATALDMLAEECMKDAKKNHLIPCELADDATCRAHVIADNRAETIKRLSSEIERLRAVTVTPLNALESMHALILGECPSLLEDDHHDQMVRDAIAKAKGE